MFLRIIFYSILFVEILFIEMKKKSHYYSFYFVCIYILKSTNQVAYSSDLREVEIIGEKKET